MSLCISISLCLGGVPATESFDRTEEYGYVRRGFRATTTPTAPPTAVSVMESS